MSDEERIRLWRSLFTYNSNSTLFRKFKSGMSKQTGSPCGRDKKYLNVRVGKGFEYVHTVIFGMHYGYLPSQIDHKDRNGLNNSPSNLRAADNRTNNCNVPKAIGKSGYRGVAVSATGVFTAKIRAGKRRIHLGTFSSAKDAAIAYNRKATELHGEFAILNRI